MSFLKQYFRLSVLIGMSFFFLTPLLSAEEKIPGLQTTSNPADDRFDFADGLYSRGMYDMAAGEYQALIKDFPDHPRTRESKFRLAESFFFLKQYDRAAELYQDFTLNYPDIPQAETAKLRLAETQDMQGKKDEALASFSNLTESSSPFVQHAAHYFAGRILIEQGILDEAEQHLLSIETPSPENSFSTVVAYHLGEIALRRKDLKKAAVYFETLQKSGKNDLVQLSDFGLGQIYFNSGKFSLARDYFLKAYQSGANKDITKDSFVNYLNALYELEDYAKVLELASQALNAAPDDVFKIQWLAANASLRLKKYPEAIEIFNQILALPELDEKDRERAAFGKIEAFLSQGDPEKAMAMADGLEKNSAAKDRWEYLKAEVLKRTGKWDMALDTLDKIIRDYPDSEYVPQAYLNKAYTLIQAGRSGDAAEAFQDFLNRFPDHALAKQCAIDQISLAIKLGRFDDASQYSLSFLEKYPESLEAEEIQYQLASLYLRQKDHEKAFSAYSDYLKKYPDGQKKNLVLFFLGLTKQLAGEPKEALPFYAKLLKKKIPDDLRQNTLKNKAVSLIGLQKLDEAANVYLHLIHRFPVNNLEPSIHFYLADYYRQKNDPEKIILVMTNLLEKPEGKKFQGRIEYFLGEAYRLKKDGAAASSHYDKALEFDKNDPNISLGKGLLAKDQGDYEEAMKMFEETIHLSGEDHEMAMQARFEVARTFEIQKNFLDAGKSYLAIGILYQSDPRVAEALYSAGENFAEAGRPDESQKAYKELIERFPDQPLAKEALKKTGNTV